MSAEQDLLSGRDKDMSLERARLGQKNELRRRRNLLKKRRLVEGVDATPQDEINLSSKKAMSPWEHVDWAMTKI